MQRDGGGHFNPLRLTIKQGVLMQQGNNQRWNNTTLGHLLASRWVRALVLLTAGLALAQITSIASYAQTTPPLERVHAASEGVTRPYSHPAIDEAGALKGAALLSALRRGGLILFMRHTQAGTVTPQCIASNLSPAGERDARFVGESIRKLGVPIGRVLSSPVCRVADTAKLLGLGELELSVDLSNVPTPQDADLGAAREKRLAEVPARATLATNTLLVSHMQGGRTQAQWIYLDFGEIVVFRPDGKGHSNAVARIRADDWYDLMALENK